MQVAVGHPGHRIQGVRGGDHHRILVLVGAVVLRQVDPWLRPMLAIIPAPCYTDIVAALGLAGSQVDEPGTELDVGRFIVLKCGAILPCGALVERPADVDGMVVAGSNVCGFLNQEIVRNTRVGAGVGLVVGSEYARDPRSRRCLLAHRCLQS